MLNCQPKRSLNAGTAVPHCRTKSCASPQGPIGRALNFSMFPLISGTPVAGPVRCPHKTLSATSSIRGKYSINFCGGMPEISMYMFFVAANQEKSFVHPQWPAAMRKNDHQIRIVDAHIVAEHRLRMQIARPREKSKSGVNHDGHAIRLRSFVDRCQAAVAVHVIHLAKALDERGAF